MQRASKRRRVFADIATILCRTASVAGLILTTQTLIAKKPGDYDPTAGPTRAGTTPSSIAARVALMES